jgi:mannose-6-phosphate isomerase-like protein (cupin superfamily)
MPPVWFIHDLADVLADDGYSLIDMLAPPGDQPPLHLHHDADEGFLVLEGEVSVWAGEEHVVLRPGEFARAPRGVPHTYRVTGETPARIVVTTSTGTFARFVQAYGEPAPRRELPPAGPPDVARLARLAAEHAIELLGPPGMLPGDLAAASAA